MLRGKWKEKRKKSTFYILPHSSGSPIKQAVPSQPEAQINHPVDRTDVTTCEKTENEESCAKRSGKLKARTVGVCAPNL